MPAANRTEDHAIAVPAEFSLQPGLARDRDDIVGHGLALGRTPERLRLSRRPHPARNEAGTYRPIGGDPAVGDDGILGFGMERIERVVRVRLEPEQNLAPFRPRPSP